MSQDKKDAEVASAFAFVIYRLASEAHKIAIDVRNGENVIWAASVMEEELKKRADESGEMALDICKKTSEREV